MSGLPRVAGRRILVQSEAGLTERAAVVGRIAPNNPATAPEAKFNAYRRH